MTLQTPLRPQTASSLGMALVMSSSTPLILPNEQLVVQAASRSFCCNFSVDPDSVVGTSLFAMGNGEWDIPQLRSLLTATASGSAAIDAYEMDLTSYYLVTAGEGRRLAMLLRAKRKQIKKSEPVRCWLDTANDPAEISLDESVTRTPMHPADQFERFAELSNDKGWGAQEIGARLGVSLQFQDVTAERRLLNVECARCAIETPMIRRGDSIAKLADVERQTQLPQNLTESSPSAVASGGTPSRAGRDDIDRAGDGDADAALFSTWFMRAPTP